MNATNSPALGKNSYSYDGALSGWPIAGKEPSSAIASSHGKYIVFNGFRRGNDIRYRPLTSPSGRLSQGNYRATRNARSNGKRREP